MDNNHNNTLHDIFDFINKECLFYSISVKQDHTVQYKWENMVLDDYTMTTPEHINRINLRVHKTRHQKASFHYFLDFFQQYCEETTSWKGFRMGWCTHYEMMSPQTDGNNGWFDVIFYFDNNHQITVRHINTPIFLVLQDFFNGFM